jgi:hypothetical protein
MVGRGGVNEGGGERLGKSHTCHTHQGRGRYKLASIGTSASDTCVTPMQYMCQLTKAAAAVSCCCPIVVLLVPPASHSLS